MKQPEKPWPPSEYTYRATTRRQYIYSVTESLQEEDMGEMDAKDISEPLKPVYEVDLGWLLTQVPAGITPNQIKIEFGYTASSMAYENHYLKFYYEVEVPAREKEFRAAFEQYKRDAAQYDIDIKAYQVFMHEKELKETEEKLARLKKKEV